MSNVKLAFTKRIGTEEREERCERKRKRKRKRNGERR